MLCARKEVHVPTTSWSRQIESQSNKCAETVIFADFLHESKPAMRQGDKFKQVQEMKLSCNKLYYAMSFPTFCAEVNLDLTFLEALDTPQ